jgi:hypothetical protein
MHRPRYVAVAAAAAIHIAALWLLASSIRIQILPTRSTEIQLNFLSPNLGPRVAQAPPLDWEFKTPEEILVPEPQITITPDQEAGEGIVASGMQKLAPRLDPTHVNQRPELPAKLGTFVTALTLELCILVSTDGSVKEALVVHSTGERDIDRIAIESIKNEWRYLPASVNGNPIDDWTSVIVRFTPI